MLAFPRLAQLGNNLSGIAQDGFWHIRQTP
jgi:hypothetical protein